MLYNDTIGPSISAIITEFDTPAPPFIVNPMMSRIDGVNLLPDGRAELFGKALGIGEDHWPRGETEGW